MQGISRGISVMIRSTVRVGILVLAPLLLAAGFAWAELPRVRDAVVERNNEAGDIAIRWDGLRLGHSVRIYAGPSPEGIDRTNAIAETTERSVTVSGMDSQLRHYFEIVPDGGTAYIVAERRLPLEGASNFRDLGGYETVDGRFVRWGLLYRSDDLADLTDADLAYLSHLDLALVCDLRSPDERESQPSRLPRTNAPQVAHLPIHVGGSSSADVAAQLRSGQLDPVQLLVEANRAFVTTHSAPFRGVLQRISEPANLPTLIHCTAGKDRTGFASAMVLLALGVSRETVLEDYMLTNRYVAEPDGGNAEFFRALWGVRREYLQAALDTIDQNYGSVEVYLRDGLGITDELRDNLRELLLR